jgi:hypothetical protein
VEPGAPPNTFRVTTARPHNLNRIAGKRNVVIGGIWAPSHPTASVNLNGAFPIRAMTDTTFDYVAKGPPETPVYDWYNSSQIGVQFHGPGADSGDAAIVEGNRVYHLWLGANHDTWTSFDCVYRHNYYKHVACASNQVMGGEDGPFGGSAISREGSVARFTSFAPHGLTTGNEVTIKDALVGNSNNNYYNKAAVTITKVDDHTFTYDAQIPTDELPHYPNAGADLLFRKVNTGWKLGAAIVRDLNDPEIAIRDVCKSH